MHTDPSPSPKRKLRLTAIGKAATGMSQNGVAVKREQKEADGKREKHLYAPRQEAKTVTATMTTRNPIVR
jgi:predicted transcriptional regulator